MQIAWGVFGGQEYVGEAMYVNMIIFTQHFRPGGKKESSNLVLAVCQL